MGSYFSGTYLTTASLFEMLQCCPTLLILVLLLVLVVLWWTSKNLFPLQSARAPRGDHLDGDGLQQSVLLLLLSRSGSVRH